MALMSPPICEYGWKAVDFSLKSVNGKTYALADVRGEKGTLIVFICNHCPYVKSVIGRIVREAKELETHGIGTVAIMPNDTDAYPADNFENMKAFAKAHDFPFPYLIDETQETAKAYEAVCTPDFFGFNAKDELQYRGRLDESKTELVEGAKRELYEAMVLVAETGQGPSQQTASMGCSIKWREAS